MTAALDFAIRNVGRLATLAGPVPRVGAAMSDLGIIESAALGARDGEIRFVGADSDFPQQQLTPDAHVVDAKGATVCPGFVDPHTHAVFAGDRDDELRRRMAGASYTEIAAEGGGIVRSVAGTRAASRDELVEGLVGRLDEMLLQGTTTAEVKSGYGLEVAAEVRSLEAIQEADQRHPIDLVATFLGAHEIPLEYRERRSEYVDLVAGEMTTEVARRKLAAFCDVFCEEGVFTVDESRRVLEAGAAAGLKLRMHADEFVCTDGAVLAAAVGARSADHLGAISPAGMRALADASCVATLLPAASFYLRLADFAPARDLIAAGVPIALASDVNPGGGFSPSLPFVMAIGCFRMGLSLEEAVTATTINAAFSLDRHERVGSLEVGKRADLVVLRSSRILDLIRVGVPAIATVVKEGRVVVRDGRRVTA